MIAGLGNHVFAELGGGRALALQVELARGPLPEWATTSRGRRRWASPP